MKFLLASFACLSTLFSFSQNHEENVKSIITIEQANSYAADYREVSVSLMNAEMDAMFFDDIDTSNLEKYVGVSKTFFGRTTKLIEEIRLYSVRITNRCSWKADSNLRLSNLLVSEIQRAHLGFDVSRRLSFGSLLVFRAQGDELDSIGVSPRPEITRSVFIAR